MTLVGVFVLSVCGLLLLALAAVAVVLVYDWYQMARSW